MAPDIDKADDGRPPRSRWHVPVLVALLAYAAALRFYDLGSPSLWIDEGFSIVHARAILDHGMPRLPDGGLSWSYAPAHYAMAAGIGLTSAPVWGGRAGSALAGTLVVALLFGLCRRLLNERVTAILAAALLAFLTYEVAWSRQARMYIYLQASTVGCLWAWFAFLDARRLSALATALLTLVLSLMLHPAGYWIAVAIVVSLGWELPNVKLWKAWIIRHWRGLTALLLTFALLLVVALHLPGGSALEQAAAGVEGQPRANYAGAYLLFVYGQLRWLTLWVAFGAAWATLRHPGWALPLLAGWCAYLYLIAFRISLFHFRYLLPTLPLLPFFAACGLLACLRALHRMRGRPAWLGRGLVLAAFAVCAASGRFQWIPAPTYDLGPTAPQPPWAAAYRWLAADIAGRQGDRRSFQTVSTFPMFHDLYLGTRGGGKYFLPFSPAAASGSFAETCRYAVAPPIESLGQVPKEVDTYVILDRFSLDRLKHDAVRKQLMHLAPVHWETGPRNNDVVIWRLPGVRTPHLDGHHTPGTQRPRGPAR